MEKCRFIQSKGFQNWMKCVTAQNETRKALCEVIEVKWKGYISQLTEEERNHMETFLECLKCAKIETLKVEQKMSCNHSVCASILQNLLQLCVNQPRQNNDEASGIPSSDSCYHQYWHLAKLYICAEDEIATKAGLKELDISVLSRMMNNCQLFSFDGSATIYNTTFEDRDKLYQSSDNQITEERMGIMLQHMSNLLSNFCGARLKMCEDVIGDIQQIAATDWLSEYPYEFKHIARESLERKVNALKLDISLCDNHRLDALLKATEILLEQLGESISAEEFDDQRALQIEVDSLKEKNKRLEMEKEEIKSERDAVVEENKELKEVVTQLEKEVFQMRLQSKAILEENKRLQERVTQLEKEVNQSDPKGNDVIKENGKLLQAVTQLEKEGCQARLISNLCYTCYCGWREFNPQHSPSNKIQVTSLGSFQDVFIQIDGISILLDPLGTDLLEMYNHNYGYYEENIEARDQLHGLSLDAIVLSTCLYSCTSTTVKKIVEKSPRVKWLTPVERKDWLVGIGVKETNIIGFDVLEEKDISFGHTKITFVCTKTNINSTSIHRKKCNSCGWVIKGSHRTFYSSGITNYNDNDFKVVAERYSPIHLALLPLFFRRSNEDVLSNMSCMSDFSLTLQEVVKMHADVAPRQSLCLHNWWQWFREQQHRGCIKTMSELERDFELEMRKLNLDPDSFYFLTPGETYESK